MFCRTLIGLSLTCALTAQAVDPIPEPQQAALAAKILEAYHGTRPADSPKKLHVVYFTPADRDPEPRYQERLDAIMEDIRAFYRDEMEKAGFGPRTFDLDRDAQGKLVIHLVKSKEPDSAFTRSGFSQDQANDALARQRIRADSKAVLEAAGIFPDRETVLMFCNLAKWDEQARKFRHYSPYAGLATQGSGWCFAVDSVILNLGDISKKKPMLHDAEWGNESIGKFNTIFIGGIAHELGHAFALPHCAERWDEKPRGTSLMGRGNHTYREELRDEGRGTFLTMSGALKLAGRPLFSKSNRDLALLPKLEKSDFQLSTNVTRRELSSRRGTLRLEGTVQGTPPVYGVIAYFDSARDGGYRAPTATAVPDADGRFAIEISDLAACDSGELRIEYCHVNGAVSEASAPFAVKDGVVNLSQWERQRDLSPLIQAMIDKDLAAARAALERIEQSQVAEHTKIVARKLVATLNDAPRPTPADAPPALAELALGDAQAQASEVGWFKPSANRIPANSQIPSPLLDSGNIYATGLFAHAPARYAYNLGGKWKTLRGEGGLHTAQQSNGSVVFVIKADGKEKYRSSVIRKTAKARYEVDVTDVKNLELVVEDGGNGKGNDWGLWLEPTLFREAR